MSVVTVLLGGTALEGLLILTLLVMGDAAHQDIIALRGLANQHHVLLECIVKTSC